MPSPDSRMPQRAPSFVAAPHCMTPSMPPPSRAPAPQHSPDPKLPMQAPSFLAAPFAMSPPGMAPSGGSLGIASPAAPRVMAVPSSQERPQVARSPSWTSAVPSQSGPAVPCTPERPTLPSSQSWIAYPGTAMTQAATQPQLPMPLPSARDHPQSQGQSHSWAPPPVASVRAAKQSNSWVPPPREVGAVPGQSHSWAPPPLRHEGGPRLTQSNSWVPPPSQEPGPRLTQSLSWVPPPDGVLGAPLSSQSLSWVPPPEAAAVLGPVVGPQQSLSWTLPQEGVATSLGFTSSSASRQHPAKVNTGIVNADAVLEGETYVGICDGVSGVHHLGIPPDELPRELLRSCREHMESWAEQSEPERTDDGTWLTGLIEEAYDDTQAYGATTLLLAALRDSDLVTACLGDCALLVLRPCGPQQPGRLRAIFKTEPGRYDSRRPVQVQRLHGFSDANAHTVIQGAMVSTTPVQHGDLLVIGSDGLFDNLRDEDIQRTVEQHCLPGPLDLAVSGRQQAVPTPALLKRTAEALVDLAISRVKLDKPDNSQLTPWNSHGGDVPANNADDTTALLAAVVQAPPRVAPQVDANTTRDDILGNSIFASCPAGGGLPASGPAVLKDSTNMATRRQQKERLPGHTHRSHHRDAGGAASMHAQARGPAQAQSCPGSPRLGAGAGGRGPHNEIRAEECVVS